MIIRVFILTDDGKTLSAELEISEREFITSKNPSFIFKHNFDTIRDDAIDKIFKKNRTWGRHQSET